MSYKQIFDASGQDAYNKSLATKIEQEMSKLRSQTETSPSVKRRWVWELIQNAKDVCFDKGVNIEIDYKTNDNENSLIFRHDGKPFSADNLRYLIEQTSTKDRTKDNDGKSKTTGRFGTGFLSTHLLSEFVTVKGVLKEDDLEYKKFSIKLDRSGEEADEITESIKLAKDSVKNIDEIASYDSYDYENHNTEFYYSLSDKIGHEVCKDGLFDINNCLPYTLALVQEINQVHIISTNKIYINSKEVEEYSPEIEIHKITILTKDDLDDTSQFVLKVSNGLTSLVMPVSILDDKVSLEPIPGSIPRLFCEFPLVGAKHFPFPLIINNPNFHPTEPRDGILLNSPERAHSKHNENKEVVKEAIELYFKLLEFATINKWGNLHLLANFKPFVETPDWVDKKWLNNNLITPLRNSLLQAKIVRTSTGTLESIKNGKDEIRVWFPSASKKDIREKIWELANLWIPNLIPHEDDVELWHNLLWNDCGYLSTETIGSSISQKKTLEVLKKEIKEIDVYNWLSKFFELIDLEETNYLKIIDKFEIYPNQNGEFCKKNHLKGDQGDIPLLFKDVLDLLKEDVRDRLLDENLAIEMDEEINSSDVIRNIVSKIDQVTVDREVAKSYNGALKKLLGWFHKQPSEAKKLFPTLYKRKHLLYNDEEILENISKAEELDDLLNKYEAKSINELRDLLETKSNASSYTPVTQEIIASMGITSIEEWGKALEDKDLALLFSHESVPTTDYFIFAQSLIQQAKKSVLNHLSELDDYDITSYEETALTVLAGIIKNDTEISIVVRPAYNNEVIIYYGSEEDVLNYAECELWVDTNSGAKEITLGHILKTAKIKKFPI